MPAVCLVSKFIVFTSLTLATETVFSKISASCGILPKVGSGATLVRIEVGTRSGNCKTTLLSGWYTALILDTSALTVAFKAEAEIETASACERPNLEKRFITRSDDQAEGLRGAKVPTGSSFTEPGRGGITPAPPTDLGTCKISAAKPLEASALMALKYRKRRRAGFAPRRSEVAQFSNADTALGQTA